MRNRSHFRPSGTTSVGAIWGLVRTVADDADHLLVCELPVDWANGMTGGRVHGRDAVRAYWEAQWLALDPKVEPVHVGADDSGAVVVTVHQLVKDHAGAVLLDRMVRHVYRLRDELVARMDIHEDA